MKMKKKTIFKKKSLHESLITQRGRERERERGRRLTNKLRLHQVKRVNKHTMQLHKPHTHAQNLINFIDSIDRFDCPNA